MKSTELLTPGINWRKFIPVVLILLFVALSLTTINSYSLWHDEGYTATLVEQPFSDIVSRTAKDVHPPFYYLLLKSWALVFDDSIFALRSFSLVMAVGALLVAWKIFRKLTTTATANWALLGMVLGSYTLRYSQEMRMYSLGALIAMTSLYSLISYTQSSSGKQSKNKLWLVLYAMTIAAGLYTQYFLLFMIPAHGLWVWGQNIAKSPSSPKRNLSTYLGSIPRWWVGTVVAALAVFAVWIPTMISQFQAVNNGFWIGPIKIETFINTVTNVLLFQQSWDMDGWAAMASIAAVVFVIWSTKHASPLKAVSENYSQLLILTIVLPLAILILISLPPFTPAYQVRYISFYAPLVYGLIGVVMGVSWQNKRKLTSIVIACILFSGSVSALKLGNDYDRRPLPVFRMNNVSERIAQDFRTNDLVLSTSLGTFFDAHYTMRLIPVKLIIPPEFQDATSGNWSAVYGREDLLFRTSDGMIPNNIPHDRVWIIGDQADLPENAISSDFLDTWEHKESNQYGHVFYSLYIKK